jgi:hypothetical protein
LSPIRSPDKISRGAKNSHQVLQSRPKTSAVNEHAAGALPEKLPRYQKREGSVADFSVRRLTLWSRSQAIETRRVPAPSRLAQRDAAKASTPGGPKIHKAHSKRTDGKGSWRRAEKQPQLAWRTCPDCAGRAELEETKSQNSNTNIVPDRAKNPKQN